jgi:hypothetical protein
VALAAVLQDQVAHPGVPGGTVDRRRELTPRGRSPADRRRDAPLGTAPATRAPPWTGSPPLPAPPGEG